MYGETAICRWRYSSEQINSKRRMAWKDRLLVALGVEYTLTDGSVEKYPRLQQSTLTSRTGHAVYFQRSKRLRTLESVKLSNPA